MCLESWFLSGVFLELMFDAIGLKKLLNSFAITLLSVRIGFLFVSRCLIVWVFIFINTIISCQILYVFFLFSSNRFLK